MYEISARFYTHDTDMYQSFAESLTVQDRKYIVLQQLYKKN